MGKHTSGQVSEQMIRYVIMLSIAIAIVFFGLQAYSMTLNWFCKTDVSNFELSVKNAFEKVTRGTSKEMRFDVPCKADALYFIQKGRATAVENTFVQDQIDSQTKDNVFITKEGLVLGSFEIDRTSVASPYHLCLDTSTSEIGLFVDRVKDDRAIVAGCSQQQCLTPVPMLTDDNLQPMVSDFVDFDCPDCPQTVTQGIRFYKRINPRQATLYRSVSYCDGKTIVTMTLVPKSGVVLEDVAIHEYANTEGIDDLERLGVAQEGGDRREYQYSPALLIWGADEVRDSLTVSYSVNANIAIVSAERLTGFASARVVRTLTPQPPQILIPFPFTQLQVNQEPTVVLNIFDYIDDIDTSFEDLNVGVTYTQGSENSVAIDIEPFGDMTLTPGNLFAGEVEATIMVSDDTGQVEAPISIRVSTFPEIGELPDVTFETTGTKIIANSLNRIISDDEQTYSQITKSIQQSDTSVATCSIVSVSSTDDKLQCVVHGNPGVSAVTLSATDAHGQTSRERFVLRKVNSLPEAFRIVCRKQAELRCTDGSCQAACAGFDTYRDDGWDLGCFMTGNSRQCICYDQYTTSCSRKSECDDGYIVHTQSACSCDRCGSSDLGDHRCVGVSRERCGDYNNDGCYEWGARTRCQGQEICGSVQTPRCQNTDVLDYTAQCDIPWCDTSTNRCGTREVRRVQRSETCEAYCFKGECFGNREESGSRNVPITTDVDVGGD